MSALGFARLGWGPHEMGVLHKRFEHRDSARGEAIVDLIMGEEGETGKVLDKYSLASQFFFVQILCRVQYTACCVKSQKQNQIPFC